VRDDEPPRDARPVRAAAAAAQTGTGKGPDRRGQPPLPPRPAWAGAQRAAAAARGQAEVGGDKRKDGDERMLCC